MELFRHLRQRNWPTIFGYGLFAGTMAVGYYYNLTFVQIGLHDLGTRLVGMSEQRVATAMAYLALLTCAAALAFGLVMRRLGWSRHLVVKLRLAAGIVAFQTILTAVAGLIRAEDVL